MIRDLTGQTFGRLTVLGDSGKRSRGLVVWRCRCECGRECEVVGQSLVKGATRSCGCLKRGSRDLAGQRFGRLVAIEPTDRREAGSVVWKCRCDCGNDFEASAARLRAGRVRSCGCLRSDAVALDLAGKRFGRLVAVRPVGRRGGYVLWECRCDCGNTALVTAHQLSGGNTRSCGCLRGRAGGGPLDLAGKRFGRLVARERAGTRGRYALWRCDCDCGNAFEATSRELVSGRVRSCGCLAAGAAELAGRRFGKLVAAEPCGVDEAGAALWRCLCDCGNVAIRSERDLLEGAATSCDDCEGGAG